MPLHQPTLLGSRRQSHHLIFDQSESVALTTSPLDYSEAEMRAAPAALTAEYVADDQPVYDHDVISAEPHVAERPSVYRTQDTLNAEGKPNITGKVG